MTKFHIEHILSLILILVFFGSFDLNAQENCSLNLMKAQKLYEDGVIEQIPQILQPCINEGFTNDERVQAMKLIILSYLFDNNEKEAENTMLIFIKNFPDYECLATDQAEFIQLFKTYQKIPTYAIGAMVGSNLSLVHPTNLFGTNGEVGEYTSNGMGFQGGISYRKYYSPKYELNIEALFSSNSYQFVNSNLSGGNKVTFSEKQSYIQLPITGIYNPKTFGDFSPFLRGGLNFGFLISSNADIKRENSALNISVSESGTDWYSHRNTFQLFGVLGCGVTYNLKNSFLVLDLRYNLGFMNQVNNANRNTNQDLFFKYLYNENEFKLNSFAISISYYFRFFKTQKMN